MPASDKLAFGLGVNAPFGLRRPVLDRRRAALGHRHRSAQLVYRF
jgi:hypothetical protein